MNIKISSDVMQTPPGALLGRTPNEFRPPLIIDFCLLPILLVLLLVLSTPQYGWLLATRAPIPRAHPTSTWTTPHTSNILPLTFPQHFTYHHDIAHFDYVPAASEDAVHG
ncbi:hypothetical protein JMJ35_003716 [Cladonia borealis]|uniref:Uncharacterized protein n=1 Tax=Cladonia borealis TaxID=184061 RepID=A0AA39R5G1_9LECA|nr:hypothetical protein JMJ35_003716 [Cladonia borealis]